MPIVIVILITVALILIGATMGKPLGWVVLTLAVIALLLAVLGGVNLHIGFLEGESGGARLALEQQRNAQAFGDRDLRLPLNPSYYGG